MPFFKPNSLRMQLLSGSHGATSHMRIFSIVLGNYRSQMPSGGRYFLLPQHLASWLVALSVVLLTVELPLFLFYA